MFNISQNFIKYVLWIFTNFYFLFWGVVAINYIHYFSIVFISMSNFTLFLFLILLFHFHFHSQPHAAVIIVVFLKSHFNSLSFNRLEVPRILFLLLLFKQTEFFFCRNRQFFKTSRIDEWQTKEMENKILALWSISVSCDFY